MATKSVSGQQPPKSAADNNGRLYYALIAGTCAALGSFFGKLTSGKVSRSLLSGSSFESMLDTWLLTLIFVGLMLLSNGMVWTFFVKALHSRGGSVVATVTSSTTNFLVSALLGGLVFGETTSLLWWTGTSLIVLGLLRIGSDGPEGVSNDKKRV